MNTHTLSVIVENKPGVLARISGLFARRGYNIDSLAVGPTERAEISRITLQVSVEHAGSLEQITKQLNKLIEVLKIVELEENAVRRELVLVKMKADPVARSQIIEIVQLFRGKTVDVHNDSLVIEATGSPDKLEALLEMLRPYGVRELVQSGLVALGRGSKSLTDRGAKVDRARPGVR
ncbi:MAG: acetolactate synthase small subunit [Nigerium sp.]|nr:acetolactate synthase small subunit [Nigerium sp.]